MKIVFSTRYCSKLAKEIAEANGYRPGKVLIDKFAGGEIYIRLEADIKNQDVIVVGSVIPPADNFLELVFLANLLKEEGASSVCVIIPYLGYMREDEKIEGEAFTSKIIIGILNLLPIDSIEIIDIHSERVRSMFKHPVIYRSASGLFADKLKGVEKPVVVAPDDGAKELAKRFADLVKAKDLAFIKKSRVATQKNVVKKMELKGDVKGRNAIVVDDMIDTGGTVLKAAELLKDSGAKDIYVAATHGLFSGNCIEKLERSEIKEVLVTDTINNQIKSDKIKVLPVARLFKSK